MTKYDISRIREQIVVALFSNDHLLEKLVLKGGNALELVHGIVKRGSLDLDFSLADAFPDVAEAGELVQSALESHLGGMGLRVFDFLFEEKPRSLRPESPAWWGGYMATFKLIPAEDYARLVSNEPKLRNHAIEVDARHNRKFKIDFSKYEYCDGKQAYDVDDYVVYAYTPEMIAAEKLRAICQQMPDYIHIDMNRKRPRARDFYDIVMIAKCCNLDFASPEMAELTVHVFNAKGVDIKSLLAIATAKGFHASDWAGVSAAAQVGIEDFDSYFDKVVEFATTLAKTLRIE